jgi:uncharacterized protein YndB with AHSA1/START domain
MQVRPLDSKARAVYDLSKGMILGAVELPVPPGRAFAALLGEEVTRWWVNPGIFDTREWEADVRPGGAWRAAGIGRGQPYALEGEFVEVQPPSKLVHTWRSTSVPDHDSKVTYLLDPIPGGTRLTLRHEGFAEPSVLARTCVGWETSLEALGRLLSPTERGQGSTASNR